MKTMKMIFGISLILGILTTLSGYAGSYEFKYATTQNRIRSVLQQIDNMKRVGVYSYRRFAILEDSINKATSDTAFYRRLGINVGSMGLDSLTWQAASKCISTRNPVHNSATRQACDMALARVQARISRLNQRFAENTTQDFSVRLISTN